MTNFDILEEKCKKWDCEPPQHGEHYDSAIGKIIKLIEKLEADIEYANQFHWD